MTDPERLSRSSANSLAALLLQAAAHEKPSAAVLRRATQAVAAPAAIKSAAAVSAAPASATAAPSATTGLAAVVKWLAIGALGGAGAMSSLQALTQEQGTQKATATVAVNATVTKASPQSTEVAKTSSEPSAPAEPKPLGRANAGDTPPTRSAEPALGELAKPEAPERTESAFLAAEVRFVERGRSALQRARFSEVLEQLAPYERQFPHRQLLTEVLFLRMEAFRQLGNVERARALAARILTLGVVGRQAAQARAVLGP